MVVQLEHLAPAVLPTISFACVVFGLLQGRVAESQGRTMNAVVIGALAEYLGGAKSLESQLAVIKTALLALTKKVNKQDPAA
jgi:hypothetical protein